MPEEEKLAAARRAQAATAVAKAAAAAAAAETVTAELSEAREQGVTAALRTRTREIVAAAQVEEVAASAAV